MDCLMECLCDVCDRKVPEEQFAGVAASALGPVSFGFCRECLARCAEPLWVIHTTFDCCGGPDKVASWVKEICSYKDGRYITWNEIVACYVPRPIPSDPQDEQQPEDEEV